MEHAPKVLFLCTGNICRSPIAEGLLRQRAQERGVGLEVRSRGLGLRDQPATPEAQKAARRLGADISAHRSAVVDRPAIDVADLVLGMERHHVREAMVAAAGSFEKAFTLKDFADRADQIGARAPGEGFVDWVRRVGTGRQRADVLGFGTVDEVADPYLRPFDAYERCAAELAALVDRLLVLGWPAGAEGAA